MLLDAGGLHTAAKSRSLAAKLHIELIWLPKRCPELNGIGQLWRSVKDDISINYHFNSIDKLANFAEAHIRNLANTSTPKSGNPIKALLVKETFLQKIMATHLDQNYC